MTEIRRILSIDGGGIRGAMPIAFLARLEEITGLRVVDHFDLIAGTSTGGVIALGLGLGIPAATILDFYVTRGPGIFGLHTLLDVASPAQRFNSILRNFIERARRSARWAVAPKHKAEDLRRAFDAILGDRVLGESLTRLVIPAYHPDRRTVYVFKTSHHAHLEVDHRWPAVDVALATAAAPTYFNAHEMPSGAMLVDGGIWANNPMGLAAVEAVSYLGWSRPNIRLLSLGCGDDVFSIDPNAGIARLGTASIALLMQGQSFGAFGTAKLLLGEENLLRIDPVVPRGLFTLDDANRIARLAGIGAECAREALPKVRNLFLFGPREQFVPCHGRRSAEAAQLTGRGSGS